MLGGAVGALVGILLAPRSGRELRGSLANRAGEARERSRERYFGAQEQMRDRLAEARDGSRKPRPGVANLGGADEERSEELRRKVKETRDRLRGREDGGPGRET